MLFLIFVNDMLLFSRETDIDAYADDTSMHTADKDSDIDEQRLQQEEEEEEEELYYPRNRSMEVEGILH